jgi:Pyruvate/2-oxoacid:ferredoxin oxidoreductase gamma subunit
MQTMRDSWTDERLDDLKESMNERFDQVDRRFGQVDARLDRVDTDIRELRKMMVQGFIATITIMVTCFFGLTGLLFLL